LTQAIEYLIHRGHSPEMFLKPRGYTHDQIWLFYKAATDNEAREYKQTLFAYRVAQHAGGREFKKYIRDMDISKTVKAVENKKENYTPRSELRKLGRMLGGGK